LNFYWSYLDAGIMKSGRVELQALAAYRQRHYDQAIRLFERLDKVKLQSLRRFYASALIEENRFIEARQLLSAVLNEAQPDLRELILLKKLVKPDAQEGAAVAEKIEANLKLRALSQDWKVDPKEKARVLHEGQSAGLEMNFMPGRVRLSVMLKLNSPDGMPGLARLKVWEQDRELVSASAVSRIKWQRPEWEFETTGGWRWIQLSLEPSFRESSMEPSGRTLNLGTLQVEYPE